MQLSKIAYILLAALVVGLCACSGDGKVRADAIEDRSQMPILDARGVSTLVSDSGIVRYRVNAETWQLYDKAQPSYWDFPQGIYLEKFDEDLNVEASLRSDLARYWDKTGIWELTGNVHAVNEEGEIFDTPKLYWDQQQEKIYSDTVIRIQRETSVIEGVGFESNQTMSQYVILKPTGYFPIDDEE
ncbi:MAG: LPS export ABC transporter periplasmic protein LptC [Paludibacteraceae bacterium]|nr:LPS export ABC transporter periplasmic protein LptC [Paludibacteraceae bacterium]